MDKDKLKRELKKMKLNVPENQLKQFVKAFNEHDPVVVNGTLIPVNCEYHQVVVE